MQVDVFFKLLWQDYLAIAPQAKVIHDLFTEQGERVVNDHVAFRSLSNSPIDIAHLEPLLIAMGYLVQDEYQFESKKLLAKSYIHNSQAQPKIFLSELQRHLLSPHSQTILSALVQQIPLDAASNPKVFSSGLLWLPLSFDDYQVLVEESEYASWLSTLGLRANHFTVSLNHLQGEPEMQAVIELLDQKGFAMNKAGGTIKGEPKDLLVQAATLADKVRVEFSCGTTKQVPSCFYEFARRYPEANGVLFEGFITNNADKIFESTHGVSWFLEGIIRQKEYKITPSSLYKANLGVHH